MTFKKELSKTQLCVLFDNELVKQMFATDDNYRKIPTDNKNWIISEKKINFYVYKLLEW